jgi:hypothetical protein
MFVELLVELQREADREAVQALLRARGFEPLPMKAGILLGGEVEALRQLLPGFDETATGPHPVPELLKDTVRSIRMFKPRSFH